MGGSEQQRSSGPGRPLTIRGIVLGGVVVGLVGVAAFVILLHFYGGGTDQDRAGLEVVRTAGTFVVGAGGVVVLWLTARRQRSTELTLEHQREDAAEQRITTLYTHAVDQLGSDRAPIRLGGLYSLERLAQNNPAQRQTIVDVICAYLRMPYALPDDNPPGEDAPDNAHTRHEQRRQELQVRLTAQRILTAHLKPKAADAFWTGIDLDLTEARLHRLDLSNCHVQEAQFRGAQFDACASFGKTRFGGPAMFGGARFGRENADFQGARFDKGADFGEAQFDGRASFGGAQFGWSASFRGARFGGYAMFDSVRFSGHTMFDGAMFDGDADVQLGGAPYTIALSQAGFRETQLGRKTTFDGAQARPHLRYVWPAGWATREARAAEAEVEGWVYLVRVEDPTRSLQSNRGRHPRRSTSKGLLPGLRSWWSARW